MRPITVTVGPLAAPNAANIAGSQTPSGAGNLTLTAGAIAGTTPDTARRVLVTTNADESANTFTIYGTDWNNNPVSETMTGPNHTTGYTVYDYRTVTKISISGAASAAVTVGTNGIASSRPIFLDTFAPAPTSIQVTVSGTVNYTVRQSLDNPNTISGGYTSVTWVNHPDAALVAVAATAQGNYAYLPFMCQVLLNSNTNPGTVTMTVIQADA